MKKSELRELYQREKRCVCRQCGSHLEVRRIIYCEYGGEGIELYCPHCERVEYGVEPEIYRLARNFVKDAEFNYYMDMPEDQHNFELNTSKVCEILTWVSREADLLTRKGLTDLGKQALGGGDAPEDA